MDKNAKAKWSQVVPPVTLSGRETARRSRRQGSSAVRHSRSRSRYAGGVEILRRILQSEVRGAHWIDRCGKRSGCELLGSLRQGCPRQRLQHRSLDRGVRVRRDGTSAFGWKSEHPRCRLDPRYPLVGSPLITTNSAPRSSAANGRRLVNRRDIDCVVPFAWNQYAIHRNTAAHALRGRELVDAEQTILGSTGCCARSRSQFG